MCVGFQGAGRNGRDCGLRIRDWGSVGRGKGKGGKSTREKCYGLSFEVLGVECAGIICG